LLQGVLLITVCGFLAGELAGVFKFPKLIGMLLAGIIIGPYVLDLLPEAIMGISEEIRMFVLLIILFKAGLGLDKEKLMAEGSVTIRLGFLPALIETIVVAVAARWFLGWSWQISFLLGWIICAASPAVIVPMMLWLKAEGWGAKKGVPDLVLAGGTMSDAVAVTMFGITVSMILGETGGDLWFQFGYIPTKILLGALVGYLAGRATLIVIDVLNVSGKHVKKLIVSLGIALLLMIGSDYAPYSEFLAIMVQGFVILELNPVGARRLRRGVDQLWKVGEIFLFVLIGAAVNINVIYSAGAVGLAIIIIGLVLGRTVGVYLSTVGSSLNQGERFFVAIGQMAKATVQAAIGGIPLALGIEHGEYILAISVLSILFTAPIGAFGTAFFAPRLLKEGRVDPTKVSVKEDYTFLVAVEKTEVSRQALEEAARVARQVDAKLVIVNFFNGDDKTATYRRIKNELEIARDIEHEIVIDEGNAVDIILDSALEHDVDYIYMGKSGGDSTLGEISYQVVKRASIPVILVED